MFYSKKTTTTIEPLRGGDVAALRRLFLHALDTDFHYFPYEYRHEISQQNRKRHFITSLLRKGRIIYVAKENSQLIGYIVAGMLPGKVGYIYWLYVDPTTRGKRVGVQLVQRTIAAMRRENAKKVVLVTYNFDGYYKKLGFTYSGSQEIHGVNLHEMTYNYSLDDNASQQTAAELEEA